MKRSFQQSISSIMTVIYLLITLSPLASICSQSKPFLQAVSRECSGDCRLCGCSVERSAAHACCCWQKKLADAKLLKRSVVSKSCPTSAAATDTQSAGSCCGNAAHHDDSADEDSGSAQATTVSDAAPQTVNISTLPCGSGKVLTFATAESFQHLPCRFLAGIPIQRASKFFPLQPERLASQYCEPPDPPPKFSVNS